MCVLYINVLYRWIVSGYLTWITLFHPIFSVCIAFIRLHYIQSYLFMVNVLHTLCLLLALCNWRDILIFSPKHTNSPIFTFILFLWTCLALSVIACSVYPCVCTMHMCMNLIIHKPVNGVQCCVRLCVCACVCACVCENVPVCLCTHTLTSKRQKINIMIAAKSATFYDIII